MNTRSFVWSVVLFTGLVALFAGERLAAVGTGRVVLGALGVALLFTAVVVRGLRFARADGDLRRVEGLFFILSAVVVAALALYGLQSDLWASVADLRLERTSPKLATVLAALWPAVLTAGLLPMLFGELAYAAMHRSPQVEAGRVRDAALSGFGVAAVLVFGFSAYYVASERDAKWDFSYFRTTRPGEATLNAVRALEEPLEVYAFFPPSNEVREEVVEYLKELERHSPHLAVETLDQALEPTRAKELGVSGNGTVVLMRGERKELFAIGLELRQARGQLRSLDGDFHKRLMTLTRPRQTVYFTAGHGERGDERMSSSDQRWTVRKLRDNFRRLNHEVKTLGPAQGLGNEVPEDAAAVVIAGPTEALMPEVEASLLRYLDRGGRVLLALDPEPGHTFEALLEPHGLAYEPTVLANDRVFRTNSGALPHRVNLITANYSSHPSVTTPVRLGQQGASILVRSGALRTATAKEGVRVDVTVRSHEDTFADANGNYEADADERRDRFPLAAAVSKTREGGPETRLLVLADSDMLGDPVIDYAGNAYIAQDGLKWLLGEEQLVGEVNTEEDVPVEHTRKQDVAWFYSTVVLVPALVLGVGFFASRGGRRKARKETTR